MILGKSKIMLPEKLNACRVDTLIDFFVLFKPCWQTTVCQLWLMDKSIKYDFSLREKEPLEKKDQFKLQKCSQESI